jgi:O-acetylhomoserine/O-acetylserine sulfhydrylase-like pyridoxal-dependent enzyme
MAALENGAAALAASLVLCNVLMSTLITDMHRSGQAALFITITALASTGDNIIVASQISESSSQQFKYRLSTLGIETRFIESGDVDLIRQAIDENTKGVFVESISSDLIVSDIKALATVAHEAGVPLIVYQTFPPHP